MIFSKSMKRLKSLRKPTKQYVDEDEKEAVKHFLAAYRKAKADLDSSPEESKPAEVVSSTGYQMDVLRSVYPNSHARLHPTYKAFIESGEEKYSDCILPVFLRFYGRDTAPTPEELTQALKDLKDGNREPIITSVDGWSSSLGETEDSIVLKGLKKLKD